MSGHARDPHGAWRQSARSERGWRHRAAGLLALLVALTLAAPAPTARAAACSLAAEFLPLAGALAGQVGSCAGTPRSDPVSGDVLQPTTRGLLVRRTADRVVGFTDGTSTWLAGPCGLQQRPNGARFAWESGAGCGPPPSEALGFHPLTDVGCRVAGGTTGSYAADLGPGDEATAFSFTQAQVILYLHLLDCPLSEPLPVHWDVRDPDGQVLETADGSLPAGHLAVNGWTLTLPIARIAGAGGDLWSAQVMLGQAPLGEYRFWLG